MAGTTASKAWRFGAFEVDLQTGELRKSGIRIKLQEKPLQVLAALLEDAGQLVTREDLRQKLWPADTFVDFDHSLGTAIAKLRQALGDSAQNPRFVETVASRGYRFIAPVTRGNRDPEAQPAQVVPQPHPAKPRPSLSTRWFAGSVLAGLMAGALVLTLSLTFDVGGVRRFLRWRTSPPVRALAVLPLENHSGDAAQEYFTDGMTDELITRLAQLENVRVISRTSVMRYKHNQRSLAQIGRDLNVDTVVEGSVMRSGRRVRITAQLIDVATDQHLWAASYERDLGDVLMLQGEISRAIADEIRVKLAVRQQTGVAGRASVDPEVYELCLLGRYQWNKRTEAGLRKAIEYFHEALDRDPNYAPAYAGLADSYMVLPYYSRVSMGEVYPKARAAALRALELDEKLPEAHTTLAFVNYNFFDDWPSAEREFKRALELNPNYATAHHWYAFYLWQTSRRQEALLEVERARQLDPLSLIINADEGTLLFGAYQPDAAIARLLKAVEIDPEFAQAHRILALVYAQQGRFPEAMNEGRKALDVDANDTATMACIGYLYAITGRKDEAGKMLTALKKLVNQGLAAPDVLAYVYTGLGERDRAIQSLEETYEGPSRALLYSVTVLPLFDSLSADPRYQSLLQRLQKDSSKATISNSTRDSESDPR
jgi:TolB-like protein/DNA-binding winged helix-turn-helix (wHTH) protein/Flp pilus assembly protein TadD